MYEINDSPRHIPTHGRIKIGSESRSSAHASRQQQWLVQQAELLGRSWRAAICLALPRRRVVSEQRQPGRGARVQAGPGRQTTMLTTSQGRDDEGDLKRNFPIRIIDWLWGGAGTRHGRRATRFRRPCTSLLMSGVRRRQES